MTRIFAITAGLAIVGLVAGLGVFFYVARPDSADVYAQCRDGGTVVGKAAIGGDFTLVNHLGQTVNSAQVITKPSLIYFGFTFCRDVCPLDVARNAAAVDLLSARNIDVTPVFISIDPARDTPEVVADYVRVMHPRMIGLTGSMAQVKSAAQAYKAYFRKADDSDDYEMDHSTFTYLMLPKEGFIAFFRRTLTPVELADKVGCFAKVSGV